MDWIQVAQDRVKWIVVVDMQWPFGLQKVTA
jgi:hypothetical protein